MKLEDDLCAVGKYFLKIKTVIWMDTTVLASLGEDSKVRTLMLKPHDCYKKEDIHFKTRAITSSKKPTEKSSWFSTS